MPKLVEIHDRLLAADGLVLSCHDKANVAETAWTDDPLKRFRLSKSLGKM